MEQNNYTDYTDEISLRELIEIILKGKRIIAMITIIAMVISLLVSFLVLSPQYEASTTLITSPITSKEVEVSSLKNVADIINQYPSMTIETYKEQVKTPQLLEKVIKELELKNEEGKYISISSLSKKISVSNIKDTNLITIKVNDTDPEKATLIANTISDNFIDLISENNRRISEQAAKTIEDQIKIEEENLNEKSQKLAKYISQNKSVTELKNEVNSIISQLTDYKSKLNDIEKSIQTNKAALVVLLGANEGVSSINLNDISINITNNGSITEEIKTDISKPDELQAALLRIKTTELETGLVKNVAEKEALDIKIQELQTKLKETQTTLAEEEYKYNSVNREYQLANQAYNAYQQRHKEAIAAAAAEIGKSSIIVSSYAITPEIPVGPNKKLNLAISIVLGLMVGIFVVFFKAYWKDTANESNK